MAKRAIFAAGASVALLCFSVALAQSPIAIVKDHDEVIRLIVGRNLELEGGDEKVRYRSSHHFGLTGIYSHYPSGVIAGGQPYLIKGSEIVIGYRTIRTWRIGRDPAGNYYIIYSTGLRGRVVSNKPLQAAK